MRSPRAGSCWPAVWTIRSGAVLITGDISAEDAQDIVDRDPLHRPRWPDTTGSRSKAHSAHQVFRSQFTASTGISGRASPL